MAMTTEQRMNHNRKLANLLIEMGVNSPSELTEAQRKIFKLRWQS